MDLSIYLAFTQAEAAAMKAHSGKTAWLGCHLSAYGSGISCIQPARCDMLVLTDETPAEGHDPDRVARELTEAARKCGCSRLLLDFQRPGVPVSAAITEAVVHSSPCPVGVTEGYAEGLECPVLVSPPPLWTALEGHLLRWKGREVWLEAVTEDAFVTVTPTGSQYRLCEPNGVFPYTDKKLSLSYRVEPSQAQMRVWLHRGTCELSGFLKHAYTLGIRTAVGLHQQLAAMDVSDFAENEALHS